MSETTCTCMFVFYNCLKYQTYKNNRESGIKHKERNKARQI